MHHYELADGTQGDAARFMDLPDLRPGYCWYDDAPLGANYHYWRERVAPLPDTDTLFGYDRRAFMARQYR